MNAYSKREKYLEVLFIVLMFLSLLCFAGIPALEHSYNDVNKSNSQAKN